MNDNHQTRAGSVKAIEALASITEVYGDVTYLYPRTYGMPCAPPSTAHLTIPVQPDETKEGENVNWQEIAKELGIDTVPKDVKKQVAQRMADAAGLRVVDPDVLDRRLITLRWEGRTPILIAPDGGALVYITEDGTLHRSAAVSCPGIQTDDRGRIKLDEEG